MKKRKRPSTLRVLSLAYAEDRITKEEYKKLRTMQLNSIEHGAPMPTLPVELADLNIPKTRLDLPKQSAKKKYIAVFIATILVSSAILILIWLTLNNMNA